MKRLLCWFFGHRWKFDGSPDVLQPPEAFYCSRCRSRLVDQVTERS